MGGCLPYICFIALVLHRVMRARLRERPASDVGSPERALAILRRIQTHRVTLQGQAPITGISTISDEQQAVFNSLQVKKPEINDAYINL